VSTRSSFEEVQWSRTTTSHTAGVPISIIKIVAGFWVIRDYFEREEELVMLV
jgi:hypothetical protein